MPSKHSTFTLLCNEIKTNRYLTGIKSYCSFISKITLIKLLLKTFAFAYYSPLMAVA